MTGPALKKGYVPRRMCLVCRCLKPRNELLRMVWQKDRGIFLDEEYLLAGKGLYICREGSCLRDFARGKKYRKNFLRHLDPGCLDRLKEVVG